MSGRASCLCLIVAPPDQTHLNAFDAAGPVRSIELLFVDPILSISLVDLVFPQGRLSPDSSALTFLVR